jgi:hypothetical protein
MGLFLQDFLPEFVFGILLSKSQKATFIQGDQKVFVHLMITVQKTRKNILNSFNHLP